MNDGLQIFTSPEFGELRTLDEEGKILFCATDVAKALGYAVPRKAVADHCRYVLKRNVPHPQSPDKTIEMNFIPEGDVYRLITHSTLPGAVRFESWVFDDMLPQMRKTGFYALANKGSSLQALDLLVQSLHEQQDTMNRLQVNVNSQGAEIEKLKEQTGLNREAFSIGLDNWRDNANKVVRQIVFAKVGGANATSEDYETVWNEIYTRMDARGLNMKRRLSHLQKDFPGRKFKKIDVIALAQDSKRLINDLRSVLCEMCVYYGVRLSAEQAKNVADIQQDENQTSMFDRTSATAGKLADVGAEVSIRG